MQVHYANRFSPFAQAVLAALCVLAFFFLSPAAQASPVPQAAAPQRRPPAVGTIKAISTDNLTLSTDSGAELKIQLSPDVRVVRVPPGSKDLKEAVAIQLSDLQPGDRVLVRTKPGQDASLLVASSIVAMKKADISEKQQKEREEWQRHGIGGLVSSIDTAQNTVTIKTLSAAGAKAVTIHVGNSTILRRYAPGSVNFDDAKVAPITDIKVGDQLRARGTRTADGAEFAADEIVSGSFLNIAGIVQSVDASAGILTVNDIATKKPVELKVTAESKMRTLPERMAQGIAIRLKGLDEANGAAAKAQPGQSSQASPGDRGAPGGNGSSTTGGAPRGGGDVQQMLSRLPVSPLSDFKKGDVVMVVATSGQGNEPPTVITLLCGVEPILQATTQGQAASILTPWSLSSGGGGEEGTP
jgi:hypothetical protein